MDSTWIVNRRRTGMLAKRNDREELPITSSQNEAIYWYESSANANPKLTTSTSNNSTEEKIPLFWRIFGATILSTVVLIAVTIFNNFTSTVTDLRNEISRINENRGDLVKKDDVNLIRQNLNERQQETNRLQADYTSLKQSVNTLTDRHQYVSTKSRTVQEGLRTDLDVVKQNISKQEAINKTIDEDHQKVQQLSATISILQEKISNQDRQLQLVNQENRGLVRDLQTLRERIAKLEQTQVQTMHHNNPNHLGYQKTVLER